MKNSTTKKIKITLLVSTIILLILCSLFFVYIHDVETANAFDNNFIYYNSFVDIMNKEYDSNVEISKIKMLKDLDNNNYTLIECVPTGYIIICNDSESMIEYSAYSKSPYENYDKELYYFGPAYFAVLQGDSFIHTITGLSLFSLSENQEIITSLKNESKHMHDTMVNYTKSIGLGVSTMSQDYYAYNTKWTCVNYYGYFTTKTDNISFSYFSLDKGCCGYVAASILLGYYDQFVKRCVPDKFMEMDSYGYKRYKYSSIYGKNGAGEFTEHLLNFKTTSSVSSTSTTIRECLTKYFKYYGYKNMGIYDMITPFFSNLTIKNLIDKSTPVILFGSLEKPTSPPSTAQASGHGNHAVVIYGYRKGANNGSIYSFLAHYGWAGYSQATINYIGTSTFGSMLRLRIAT